MSTYLEVMPEDVLDRIMGYLLPDDYISCLDFAYERLKRLSIYCDNDDGVVAALRIFLCIAKSCPAQINPYIDSIAGWFLITKTLGIKNVPIHLMTLRVLAAAQLRTASMDIILALGDQFKNRTHTECVVSCCQTLASITTKSLDPLAARVLADWMFTCPDNLDIQGIGCEAFSSIAVKMSLLNTPLWPPRAVDAFTRALQCNDPHVIYLALQALISYYTLFRDSIYWAKTFPTAELREIVKSSMCCSPFNSTDIQKAGEHLLRVIESYDKNLHS